MNLTALPGKLSNNVTGSFSSIDKFFSQQPTFDQASKYNSWEVGDIKSNSRFGLPNQGNFSISTSEDRARSLALTEPISIGFKILIDWDKDSGLLCDDNLSFANRENTTNNSAVSYLYRIGQTARAESLKQWIKKFKELIAVYDFLFLQIEGLDLIQNMKPGHFPTEEDRINIVLRETVDMRVQALINNYNQIWYDYVRGVEVLPSNLRRFDMFIMVYDINYYNGMLYDLDSSTVSGIDSTDPKYRVSTYLSPIADIDGKVERGELSQKDADDYEKRYNAIEAQLEAQLEADNAAWEALKTKFKENNHTHNVLPTKSKINNLQSYNEITGDITNNFTDFTGFNHMIYELKSAQIDSLESAKGFVGNVSNEPGQEFVRNNITLNYKRAMPSGEFYNSILLRSSDGEPLSANIGDFLAMSAIQSNLEREVELFDSTNDDSIGLNGPTIIGNKSNNQVTKKIKEAKEKVPFKVDWKLVGNLGATVGKRVAIGMGRDIWTKQKNKIMSQNSVIGSVLNVFANQSTEGIVSRFISDNISFVGSAVNDTLNKVTDLLPTKTDLITGKSKGIGFEGIPHNKPQLMENSPTNNEPTNNVYYTPDSNGDIQNSVRLDNSNIYSGSTSIENPTFNNTNNAYNGQGF